MKKKLFFLFLETNLFVLLVLPWVEEILPLAVWGERVVGFVRQGRTIGFGVQPSLKVFRMDFVIFIFLNVPTCGMSMSVSSLSRIL